MDGFYVSPGKQFDPGDIFLDIPFPSLRHPLEFFRPSPKDPKSANIFRPQDNVIPKSGDSPRGPFHPATVILLSHGCEIDGVQRDVTAKQTESSRRYWLAAPVRSFAEVTSDAMKDRIRTSTQPNKFYLPAGELNGGIEHFADLRKITPINVPYFVEATKTCSLTHAAVRALHAQLGLFFSGLVLYVQPISCPSCSSLIDPATFVTPSQDDNDID
jgi:hypothetical protein